MQSWDTGFSAWRLKSGLQKPQKEEAQQDDEQQGLPDAPLAEISTIQMHYYAFQESIDTVAGNIPKKHHPPCDEDENNIQPTELKREN